MNDPFGQPDQMDMMMSDMFGMDPNAFADPGMGGMMFEGPDAMFDAEVFGFGGVRSDQAMMAADMAMGYQPDQFMDMGGDFTFDLAKDMDFMGFSEMGSQGVMGMAMAMDENHLMEMGGDRTFAMVEAMGFDEMMGMDPGQMDGFAMAMDKQHFQSMGGAQTFEMIDTMGFDSFMDMGADNMVDMMGAMDATHFKDKI